MPKLINKQSSLEELVSVYDELKTQQKALEKSIAEIRNELSEQLKKEAVPDTSGKYSTAAADWKINWTPVKVFSLKEDAVDVLAQKIGSFAARSFTKRVIDPVKITAAVEIGELSSEVALTLYEEKTTWKLTYSKNKGDEKEEIQRSEKA